MKLLSLILITFFINGCGQKVPDCKPVACKKIFPVLVTYKEPPMKAMTKPILLPNGMYAVNGLELRDCLTTNAELRRICRNYAAISAKVNEVYQDEKTNTNK